MCEKEKVCKNEQKKDSPIILLNSFPNNTVYLLPTFYLTRQYFQACSCVHHLSRAKTSSRALLQYLHLFYRLVTGVYKIHEQHSSSSSSRFEADDTNTLAKTRVYLSSAATIHNRAEFVARRSSYLNQAFAYNTFRIRVNLTDQSNSSPQVIFAHSSVCCFRLKIKLKRRLIFIN